MRNERNRTFARWMEKLQTRSAWSQEPDRPQRCLLGNPITTGAGTTIHLVTLSSRFEGEGFPGGAVVENLPADAGDTGSSPGLGRYHMPRSN